MTWLSDEPDKAMHPTERLSLGRRSSAICVVAFFGTFITFGTSETDTSPAYLFLLFAIAAMVGWRAAAGLAGATAFAFALTLLTAATTGDLRLFKFAATAVLAESAFRVGAYLHQKSSSKVLRGLAAVWLISGILTLFDPHLFAPMLYRVGVAEGRGATGLTPEPSYYGLASAFLYAFVLTVARSRNGRERARCEHAAFLFVLSACISGSLYGLLVLILLMLAFRAWRSLLALTCVAGILVAANLTSDSRLIHLIIDATHSDGNSILNDESIMYRAANIQLIADALTLNGGARTDDALNSGITILFSQFGLWALPILATMVTLGSWKQQFWTLSRKAAILPVLVAMLTIGPLSNPYFWFYVGATATNKPKRGQ